MFSKYGEVLGNIFLAEDPKHYIFSESPMHTELSRCDSIISMALREREGSYNAPKMGGGDDHHFATKYPMCYCPPQPKYREVIISLDQEYLFQIKFDLYKTGVSQDDKK